MQHTPFIAVLLSAVLASSPRICGAQQVRDLRRPDASLASVDILVEGMPVDILVAEVRDAIERDPSFRTGGRPRQLAFEALAGTRGADGRYRYANELQVATLLNAVEEPQEDPIIRSMIIRRIHASDPVFHAQVSESLARVIISPHADLAMARAATAAISRLESVADPVMELLRRLIERPRTACPAAKRSLDLAPNDTVVAEQILGVRMAAAAGRLSVGSFPQDLPLYSSLDAAGQAACARALLAFLAHDASVDGADREQVAEAIKFVGGALSRAPNAASPPPNAVFTFIGMIEAVAYDPTLHRLAIDALREVLAVSEDDVFRSLGVKYLDSLDLSR